MSEELKPNMPIDEALTFADENGGKTGYPPGMLQDDSRALSRALASKPDAMLHAREAAAAIAKERAQRDPDGLRAALANAHNSLELYHAYGWPDRGGVRAALRVQIDALAAAQQPANDLRAALEDMLSGWKYIRSSHGDLYGVGWDRAQQKAERALAATQQPANDLRAALANAHNSLELYHAYGWPDRGGVRAALRVQIDALAATQQPADIHDLDRVLRLADEHAEDSHEDGTRVLDRGGLLAFAKDVLRIFGPAPSAPEQQSALGYNDALRIARGCTDYSGGYRFDPSRYTAFQDGVGTVINALTHAQERGLADHQIRALHGMGCEQPSAAAEAVAEVYHIQHAGLDDDSYATIRLLHRASDQWGLRLRAKSLLYTAPPEPLRVGALSDWKIERKGEAITVWHDVIGGYAATEQDTNIASTVLYHLAATVLDTQPTSAEAGLGPLWPNGDSGRGDLPPDDDLPPATTSFVQPVPDKCDRITWRGHYYHLPLGTSAAAVGGAGELLRDLVEEFERVFPIYYYAEPWAHDRNIPLQNAKLFLATQPTTPGGKP